MVEEGIADVLVEGAVDEAELEEVGELGWSMPVVARIGRFGPLVLLAVEEMVYDLSRRSACVANMGRSSVMRTISMISAGKSGGIAYTIRWFYRACAGPRLILQDFVVMAVQVRRASARPAR